MGPTISVNLVEGVVRMHTNDTVFTRETAEVAIQATV
jgi:hypothetical protein